MANEEQLSILKQGVEVWNRWREENTNAEIDLSEANLYKANLQGVNLKYSRLAGALLREVDLSNANLEEADLGLANLRGANLVRAFLDRANLEGADLSRANLSNASLINANIRSAVATDATLFRADLRFCSCHNSNFTCADLREVIFLQANLTEANLNRADLRNTCLEEALLVRTNVNGAKVSGSKVHGISVWDLFGEFEEQNELIITPSGKTKDNSILGQIFGKEDTSERAVITVDNIKIAQFIYLLMNNHEIRDVINTLTSKSVLILGRFSIPERKAILNALRNKLREYNLLPIVFDFDRPTDKDFTETIKTLAGLSYFVIADVTNPKSSPLELQATVPDYQIPFVPIIQEGEQPFAMMVDLQKKYNWVLNTVTYDSMETLIKVLKPLIIDPAMKKRQELRLIKAQEPEIISGKDFLDKAKV